MNATQWLPTTFEIATENNDTVLLKENGGLHRKLLFSKENYRVNNGKVEILLYAKVLKIFDANGKEII